MNRRSAGRRIPRGQRRCVLQRGAEAVVFANNCCVRGHLSAPQDLNVCEILLLRMNQPRRRAFSGPFREAVLAGGGAGTKRGSRISPAKSEFTSVKTTGISGQGETSENLEEYYGTSVAAACPGGTTHGRRASAHEACERARRGK